MLDQSLAEFMQRLLSKAAPSTPVTGLARRLHENFGLGVIRGKDMRLM